MNTFVALVCVMAVVAGCHGSGLGHGGLGLGGLGGYGGGLSLPLIETVPIYSAKVLGPAVSTANVYKAAPIPVIRKVSIAPIAPIIPAPIIEAPIIEPIITAPIIKEIPLAGYGLNGLGLGYGLGKIH